MLDLKFSLKFLIIILTSLFYLTNCAKTKNISVYKNIEYGNYPLGQGKRKLLLDLYLPNNSNKPLPVLIYIHGGGWLENSKESCPAQIAVQRDYAVACINYRYSTEAIFPAQIQDVKKAVRWLRKNADNYYLDSNRFGVWGDSAGGYLSVLLGTSARVDRLEETTKDSNISTKVQAVCDWYGLTDFTKVQMAFQDFPSSNVLEKNKHKPWLKYTEATYKLLGAPISKKPELAKLANPIHYIDANDPPFLIIHGELDRVVPISQSEILFQALKQKGIEVEFVKLPTLKHSYTGKNGESVNPHLIEITLNFFDKHLKSSSL